MMRRGGEWLATTRVGRGLFLSVVVTAILGAAYAVIRAEVGRQTRAITQRVTVIEEVSPFDVVRACLRSPRCRDLLEHPGRLRRFPSDLHVSPKLGDAAQGGGAQQPSHQGHQHSSPHQGGGKEAGKGGGHGGRSPGQGGGGSQPAPSAPSSPPSTSSPGNSDGAGKADNSKANSVAEGAGEAAEGAGEAAGGAVKEAGETVNSAVGNAVEGVGAAAEGAVCGTLVAPGCSK